MNCCGYGIIRHVFLYFRAFFFAKKGLTSHHYENAFDSFVQVQKMAIVVNDDEYTYDTDYDEKLTREDMSAIYSDWVKEIKRINKQKMTMSLQKIEAAKEVGLILGVSNKTFRLWRKEFMYNGGKFSEDSRGKHVRYQVIFDEDYCH